MVEALRRKGNPVGYFLFSGEQHGFRKASNIQRCLDAELAFYAIEVFRTGLTLDRKSTRLNSSHVAISYAVFCLKKKKKRRSSVVELARNTKKSDRCSWTCSQ